jgi:hypothetical protein
MRYIQRATGLYAAPHQQRETYSGQCGPFMPARNSDSADDSVYCHSGQSFCDNLCPSNDIGKGPICTEFTADVER